MKFNHHIRLYNKTGQHIASIVECCEDHGWHDLVDAKGKNLWCHLDRELVEVFCQLFEQENIYEPQGA